MQRYQDSVLQAPLSTPIVGASVQVNTFPGGVAATIYSDNGVTVEPNPTLTDANGRFSFYAADGRYTLVVSKAQFTTQTIPDILLEDPATSPSDTLLFAQSGIGAVARPVQTELRNSFTLSQFGAFAGTQAAAAANVAAINACFTEALIRQKAVRVDGQYYVNAPVLWGDQNATAQSSAPPMLYGDGVQTGFYASDAFTGAAVLQAWSTVATVYKDFVVDARNVGAIAFDTTWKPGAPGDAPSQHNIYQGLTIQNATATAWKARYNNQSVFIKCVVNGGTDINKVGLDLTAPGGSFHLQDCTVFNSLLDIACQNATIVGGWFYGIRLNEIGVGENGINFTGIQLSPSNANHKHVQIGSAGGSVLGLSFDSCLFNTTGVAATMLDFSLLSKVKFDNCNWECVDAVTFLGGSMAGTGPGSLIEFNGGRFHITGGFVQPTLNVVAGLRYVMNGLEISGTPTFQNNLIATEPLVINGVGAGAYAVLPTDTYIINNRSGTLTLTLESFTASRGKPLWVRTVTAQTVVSASSNVGPLAGGADGTAILAATAGKWALLVGTNADWQIMAGN